MDSVVMDETMGLVFVDILVTLVIFPTEAVPKVSLVQRGRFCSDLLISGAQKERIGFGLYD